MKKYPLLLLLIPVLSAFGQNPPDAGSPPKRSADPKEIHAYNMDQLQKHADFWRQTADKERNSNAKDLYNRVADSYMLDMQYRNENYDNELNDRPVNYEQVREHVFQHGKMLEKVISTYGNKAPKYPVLVKPMPLPALPPAEAPEPRKSYKTESGFEVKLKLED